jgi:hypothetical protein
MSIVVLGGAAGAAASSGGRVASYEFVLGVLVLLFLLWVACGFLQYVLTRMEWRKV